MSELDTLITDIERDLHSAKLLRPETWINRGGELNMYLEIEKIKLAELEVEKAKEKERIKTEMASKGEKVSDVSAENKLKLVPCWLQYEKQLYRVGKIEGFIKTAYAHSFRLN